MTGEAGLSYVEALLGLRDGDRSGVRAAVDRIESAAGHLGEAVGRDQPSEFFCGAAGVLCAVQSLGVRLPPNADYEPSRDALDRVRDHMVLALLKRHSAALDPGPRDPLGFAHGVAGELWGLVVAIGAHHEVVHTRLSELAALREFDEDGLVYWLPSLVGNGSVPSLLGSWCNGMPGHTLLWCEVARQTRNEAAMELARLCAVTSSRLFIPGSTFCCGLAGASVALQRYAELSGDIRYARRAYARLMRAIRIAETRGKIAFLALMQGTLGIALIALGRLHSERTIPLLDPACLPPHGSDEIAGTPVG